MCAPVLEHLATYRSGGFHVLVFLRAVCAQFAARSCFDRSPTSKCAHLYWSTLLRTAPEVSFWGVSAYRLRSICCQELFRPISHQQMGAPVLEHLASFDFSVLQLLFESPKGQQK